MDNILYKNLGSLLYAAPETESDLFEFDENGKEFELFIGCSFIFSGSLGYRDLVGRIDFADLS
jgi:hypothetical protein